MENKYKFLLDENAPKVLVEALKLYGVKEIAGPKHNQAIMGWAKELGLKNYTADEIAWCGLFVAIVIQRAGFEPVKDPLWADNWRKFGNPQKVAMLFDVLTFKRPGGNHVGFYVGEDDTHYHVYGGNQSNMVNIVRIEKTRLTSIRRCPWRIAQPLNIRSIKLDSKGIISNNEL